MTGNTFFRGKRKKGGGKKREGKKIKKRAMLSFSVPGAEHVSLSSKGGEIHKSEVSLVSVGILNLFLSDAFGN